MKANSISRSVITVLSCCTITLLGGWVGNRPSSSVSLNGPNVHHPGTADSSKWDTAGWTGRVVVGEYFTGINCGMCQSHENDFDLLLKRYPSTAFIALAYHGGWHTPIGNPYNDYSLWPRLFDWYGHPTGELQTEGVFGKVSADDWDDWIDGHGSSGGGDSKNQRYPTLYKQVDAELHKAPEAVLQAEATPHGGTIVAKVRVTALTPPHSDVYVRILVVEDSVNLEYTDPSKGPVARPTLAAYYKYVTEGYERVRLNHRMVVRASSRDDKYPLGSLIHGPGTVSYTFDMAKMQSQQLRNRQLNLGEVQPKSHYDSSFVEYMKRVATATFADKKNWTMDPTKLHLVALVQDVHTGDILQAQMIPVNTGPHGKLLKLPDSPDRSIQ